MMRAVAGITLMADGHDLTRADALAQAREHLIGCGMDPFEVETVTMDHPHLVSRAWWGGEERGFVQAHHDGAQPVTLVNVAPPQEVEPQ